jgi:hypothetical protein
MKKFILILLLISPAFLSNAQSNSTLEETLLWLKSKIEAYPSCGGLCYTAKVTYDLNKKEITIEYTSNLNNKVIYIIPLRNINPYGYSYSKGFLFTVKTTGNNITRYDIGSDGSKTTKYESSAYLVFDDTKFKQEGLESRLIKAFNHACKLSGGNAGQEPF